MKKCCWRRGKINFVSFSLSDIITSVMVIVTGFMAIATWKMVREVVRDRRLRIIEKKLEEFYIPLITIFSSSTYKDEQIYDKVEEIVVGKRYLCGPKTANILPEHFTAVRGGTRLYFVFLVKEDYENWVKAVDTIWEEAINYIKEYYKLGGIKEYILPQRKPKWMLQFTPPSAYA